MKKIKLGLIITGVLLLGAGCTLFGGGDKTGGELLPTTSKESFSGTFKAALAMGVPMKCTYVMNGIKSEGWVKGKQYIGQTQMTKGVVNTLMKGDCMWNWGEGETTGTTMCFDTTDGKSIWDDAGSNMPDKVDCAPAAITDAKFTPPANVKFLNMDDMSSGNVSEEDLQELKKTQTIDFQGFKE